MRGRLFPIPNKRRASCFAIPISTAHAASLSFAWCAGDLRGPCTVAAELERISDHVENIAKTILWNTPDPAPDEPADLLRMAEIAEHMLGAAINRRACPGLRGDHAATRSG